MSDDKRVDLSSSLNDISVDMLNDVKAAAAEVKQQQDAAAKDKAGAVEREKSKKSMALLVAIGTLVVILVAYWIVFARQDNTGSAVAPAPVSSKATEIANPAAPDPNTPVPPRARPTTPSAAGRDSQVVDHPSDEYEQPSSGGGM